MADLAPTLWVEVKMISLNPVFHFACDAETLFAALTDSANKRAWDTELVEERVTPRLEVGAHIHQRRRFMRREIASVAVVTALVPGEYFEAVDLEAGAAGMRSVYRITPTPDGCRLEHPFSLGSVPRFVEPLARLGLDRSLRTRFFRLARLLEAQQARAA